MIIFPFETVFYNKNKEINQNNIEYNINSFVEDYYYLPAYTTIKIGNPPQNIKFLLLYSDCGFKIGKNNKCINIADYLSHYNRNDSLDFKYTNLFNNSIYVNGRSAEDSIYVYTDLALKNLTKLENIGFFLASDTKDELCGIIGFKTENFKIYCKEMNNIFNSFKLRELINSDNWLIQYTSENEGLLIFDPELDKIIKNFDNNKLFIVNSEKNISSQPWAIIIDKILVENYNETINKKELRAEIDNDFGLIEGSEDYYMYITTTYFKEYIEQRICNLTEVYEKFYYYYAIECDKEKFEIEYMKKFPILSLVLVCFQKEFTLNYKDLFTETKYKYFFNIIFNIYIKDRWILGKPFLRKYPLLINYNLQTIGYYNEDFKTENDSDKNIPKNEDINPDNGNTFSTKFIIFIISIIILLIIISGITCYFIGKYLNKIKKKRANELDDDEFDYNSSKDNNKDLFDDELKDKNKAEKNIN